MITVPSDCSHSSIDVCPSSLQRLAELKGTTDTLKCVQKNLTEFHTHSSCLLWSKALKVAKDKDTKERVKVIFTPLKYRSKLHIQCSEHSNLHHQQPPPITLENLQNVSFVGLSR